MTVWDQVLDGLINAAIGLVVALAALPIAYYIFRPKLRFGYRIQRIHPKHRPGTTYQIAYRNVGRFAAYDVQVEAWLRLKAYPDDEVWKILPIPLASDGHLFLPHSKIWNLPELLLDKVDWSRFPEEKIPDNIADLDSILSTFDASVYVSIAATTGFGGIRRAHRTWYGSDVSSTSRGGKGRTRRVPEGL